jgi:hypothetical protein
MAMWTVVMVVMKPSVTRPDLAKCVKPMSFAVQMVVPALKRVLYVTSIKTVLMAQMRNTVVSPHILENWFKHCVYTHPLGRPRCRWIDSIKIDLLERGLSVVDWIGLAQDRYRWRALVNAVMNLRVP